MLNTRILLDIDAITIITHGTDADRQVVICTKAAPYTDTDFRQEDAGTGAPIAIVKTCDNDGGNQNNTNVTAIGTIKFDLPEEIAKTLYLYLKFKNEVKNAKTGFPRKVVDLRNLAYDDTHAGTTVGTWVPTERFILEGTDTLVLKENCFAGGSLADFAKIKNHFWFANVDATKPLNAPDYARVDSPEVSNNATVKDAFKEEVKAFEDTINELLMGAGNLTGKYEAISKGTNPIPSDADLKTDYKKLIVYFGGMTGTNGAKKAYKHDEAGEIELSSGKKTIDSILTTNRGTDKDDVVELAKKALYDLSGVVMGQRKYFFRKVIDELLLNIMELGVWKRMGVNNVDDILRANANGFVLSKRNCIDYNNLTATPQGVPPTIGEADANGTLAANATHSYNLIDKTTEGGANLAYLIDKTKEFTIKNGNYRGFPVFDGTQTIEADAKDAVTALGDNDRKITAANNNLNLAWGGRGAHKGKYTKKQIDALRSAEWFKGTIEGVNYDTATATDFENPQKCRGFIASDFNVDGAVQKLSGHGQGLDEFDNDFTKIAAGGGTKLIPTRIAYAVLSAPDAEAAYELAYFGKSFLKAGGVLEDNRMKTGSGSMLYFNELGDSKDKRLATLEIYHKTLTCENAGVSGGANYNPAAETAFNGAEWKPNNYCTKKAVNPADAYVVKCDKAYVEVKTFLETLYTDYSGWKKGMSGASETELTELKKKLQTEYLDKETSGSGEIKKIVTHWKSKIITIQTNLQTEIDKFSQQGPEMSADAKQVLETAKNAETADSEAQKFYVNFINKYSADAEIDKGVAENVVKIVKAVKEVLGTASPDEAQCNALKTLASGKAWDKAKEVEVVDGKKWVVDALDKATNRLTELLDAAKAAAKAAMESEGDAYTKIEVENETSAEAVNKITELFNKAKAAWNEKAYRDSFEQTEIKQLASHEGKDEWSKVNKYKTKEGKEYATGALEWLKSLKKKNDVALDDMKNSANGNEAMEKFKKADPAAGIEKETAQRMAIYAEFKNSSVSEEKRLAELCEPSKIDSFSDADDELDKSLEKIEKFVRELREYKEAKEIDTKGQALKKAVTQITDLSDTELKTVLDNWIKKLEARKQHLESKKQERDKENTKKPSPFYKHPVFIIGACVLAAVIIGGIAWLALKGSSSGEESEI